MAKKDRDIYNILRKTSKSTKSSNEWKGVLTEVDEHYRSTFDGRGFDDDKYRLIALLRVRIGLCLVDEGRLAEAVGYYKEAWAQIGAFDLSDKDEREFVFVLG